MGTVTMGVAGRFFVQRFGTTPHNFGTITWWWVACSGFSSESRYPLSLLARGIPIPGFASGVLPGSPTPARLPPAPPFQGVAGGGELGGGGWSALLVPILRFCWGRD